MVNIFNLAKKVYSDTKERADLRQQNRAIRTAGELKELKRKRLALEGRAKIYQQKDKEEAKLNKAREELKGRSTLGRLRAEVVKRQKKGGKKREFGSLPFKF